jgi:PAS domain S-box-containing protein
MTPNLKKIPIRTSALYAAFAGLWILLSDQVLAFLIVDPATLTLMQTYKGLFFVITTCLLLFVLLQKQLFHWEKAEQARQQNQHALAASKDYLQAVLDATNDAIFVDDANTGEIIDVNQHMCEMYGYPYEEAIRVPISQLSEGKSPYSDQEIVEWLKKARTQGPQIFEWHARHKEGHLFWVEVNIHFVVIGGQDRFVVSVRNIEQRKKIESVLKDNQRMLNTLMSNLPGMVYRCNNDSNWSITYISQGCFALTGFRPEDLINNEITFNSLIHPDDRKKVWDDIQEAVRTYSPFTLIYRLIDASNIEKWVWEQGRGVFDESDQLLFLEGFITDISEQKKKERELREINARLNILINSTPDIICFKDGQNRWLEANTADLELFQLTGVDYRGKTDAELAAFTAPIYKDAFLNCEKTDELAWQKKVVSRVEETIPSANGDKVYDVIKAPVFAEDGSRNGLIVFGRDITEKKKAEEQLRISEQTYQGILRSVTESVFVQEQSGEFIDINSAALDSYGYTHDELLHQGPELLSAPGKNDIDKVSQAIQAAYQGQPQQFEFWGIKKNGQIFPQEVSLTQGWYFGKKAVIAVIRDITARKKAEQSLYKRLSELEALRTIDRAITSSFDMKTTLNIVLTQSIQRLNVAAMAILLLDNDLQLLRYTIAQGFRNQDIENIEIHPGQGLAGKIMMERQIIYLADHEIIAQDKPFAHDEDFSSYYGIPLIARGQLKGILEVFQRGPATNDDDSDWLNFFEALANQTAIAIDNAQMFESLQYKNLELALAYDATIEGWSRALELREKESPGHAERISILTLGLAASLGMNKEELGDVRYGVLLHDIGKMGIPDEILLKKGLLNDDERAIMREHAQHAYNLLSKISYLKHSLDIPHYHHEKWDGSGYPEGLAGTKIPLAARIFAIVDVWDALTNDRPYRKAWSESEATAYIREQSGKHFDPEIVDAFIRLIEAQQD